MTRLHCFLIGLLFLASSTCLAQGAFQRVAIADNTGFAQPMAAFTVDVPAGWGSTGGVFWNNTTTCTVVVPSINWQTRSPDGRMVFEVLPRWASQIPGSLTPTFPGCPTLPIGSVRAYLEYLASQRHPGAQLLDYRERPDLRDRLQLPPVLALPAGSGMQTRNWAEAGELLIGWNENGYAMRELISVSGILTELLVDMPFTGLDRNLSLVAGAATVLRAPDGALDFNLFGQMRESIRPTAQWQAEMGGHQLAMSKISHKGAMDRAEISRQTTQEIAQIHQSTWEAEQAARGRTHEKTVDAIMGVQPYVDPQASGVVKLDSGYKHTWRLQDGTYIQTDSHLFNPYQDLGVDGEELERSDR